MPRVHKYNRHVFVDDFALISFGGDGDDFAMIVNCVNKDLGDNVFRGIEKIILILNCKLLHVTVKARERITGFVETSGGQKGVNNADIHDRNVGDGRKHGVSHYLECVRQSC